MENGLIKVPVLAISRSKAGGKSRKGAKVYNFEVEEDNSYIAGHVAVHNCFQAQSPWMEGKQISAMMGGWIVTIHVGASGQINRFLPEFVPFYESIPNDFSKNEIYFK